MLENNGKKSRYHKQSNQTAARVHRQLFLPYTCMLGRLCMYPMGRGKSAEQTWPAAAYCHGRCGFWERTPRSTLMLGLEVDPQGIHMDLELHTESTSCTRLGYVHSTFFFTQNGHGFRDSAEFSVAVSKEQFLTNMNDSFWLRLAPAVANFTTTLGFLPRFSASNLVENAITRSPCTCPL